MHKNLFVILVLMILLLDFIKPCLATASATRYLVFQIFTYGFGDAAVFPPPGNIEATVLDITKRIGTKGDRKNKLGVCLGPLTLSHTDDDMRKLIHEGFEIARKSDVAIAFHLDDQMFWQERKDLGTSESIEWLDWNGKQCTGRRLDWSETPMKIAPQLCLNSRPVRSVVTARARLIGQQLKQEVERLDKEGKQYLYAGTIVGWESMIGPDFKTNKSTGYHALVNKGFSGSLPPKHFGLELAQVTREFIELWAKELIAGGAPRDKLYCHIALLPQSFENWATNPGLTPPDVAFDSYYKPGFSLYPEEKTFAVLHELIRKHNNQPWIMAEGTNVVPNGIPGEANMETYLGQLFNHGAILANIFSWGIGGEAERGKNLFRRATENAEALSAYRKFLTGQKMVESPRGKSAFSVTRFKQKLETIQRKLPVWVSGVPAREITARSMMQRLDRSIKANKILEADAVADEILNLVR